MLVQNARVIFHTQIPLNSRVRRTLFLHNTHLNYPLFKRKIYVQLPNDRKYVKRSNHRIRIENASTITHHAKLIIHLDARQFHAQTRTNPRFRRITVLWGRQCV